MYGAIVVGTDGSDTAKEAVRQATSQSHVGRDVLITLDGGIDQLEARLKGQVNVLPPSEYIEAKRFVRHLGDASKVFKQPDAASYFNQTYAAKGRTVEQLVKNMTAQELRDSGGSHLTRTITGIVRHSVAVDR